MHTTECYRLKGPFIIFVIGQQPWNENAMRKQWLNPLFPPKMQDFTWEPLWSNCYAVEMGSPSKTCQQYVVQQNLMLGQWPRSGVRQGASFIPISFSMRHKSSKPTLNSKLYCRPSYFLIYRWTFDPEQYHWEKSWGKFGWGCEDQVG